MYCTKCGRQLEDGSIFCDACGKRLLEETTAALSVQLPVKKEPVDMKVTSQPVKICPKCGCENREEIEVCYKCGTILKGSQKKIWRKVSHPYQQLGGFLGFTVYGGIISGVVLMITCVVYFFINVIALNKLAEYGIHDDKATIIIVIGTIIGVIGSGCIISLFKRIKNKDHSFLSYYHRLYISMLIIACIMVWIAKGFVTAILDLAIYTVPMILWSVYFAKSVRVRTYMGSDEYLRNDSFTRNGVFPTPADEETVIVREEIEVRSIKKVFFGRYPQNGINKEEIIEWNVLEEKNGMALVISRYILDYMPFNTDSGDTNWDNSSLKLWLNYEFAEKAFTAGERKLILDVSENMYSGHDNSGNKITLLSVSEAKKYFTSDLSRKCSPTEYTRLKHENISGFISVANSDNWWLKDCSAFYSNYSIVTNDGTVEKNTGISHNFYGVRPVMWVNIKEAERV